MRALGGFLLLGLACAGPRQVARPPNAADPAPRAVAAPVVVRGFPLAVGTRLHYHETTATYDADSDAPVEAARRFVAEVVSAVDRGGLRAARVRALPGQDGTSLVIARGTRYWVVADDAAAEAVLADPAGDLAKLFDPAAPDFAFPVVVGKQRCDDPAAEGPMYCWMIEDGAGGPALAGLPGVPAAATQYARVYRTSPDDTEYYFAEGVGITGYRYHHHGTPNDVDVTLERLELPTAR